LSADSVVTEIQRHRWTLLRQRGVRQAEEGLELAINATPPGPERELLTFANILLAAVRRGAPDEVAELARRLR